MPLKYNVEFDDDRAGEILAELRTRVGATAELHEAMAMNVSDTVRKHIVETKKSPNTGFWSRVAASVTHTFSESGAEVIIPERGAALRYYGGTVKQKAGGPLLTIPTDNVPVQNGTRLAARDLGLLAFLPSRRPAKKGVVGVLVDAVERTSTRGKNKGKTYKVPLQRPAGRVRYILMSEVTHKPDPTVLPSDQQIAEAARDGALDYVAPML